MNPLPLVFHLDFDGTPYRRLLSGPPETSAMKAGAVELGPGETVGEHTTEGREECVVVLEGEGRFLLAGGAELPLRTGTRGSCPPETTHNVLNTGQVPLRYVYIVAKVCLPDED